MLAALVTDIERAIGRVKLLKSVRGMLEERPQRA
jgi:hypothetical protein